MGDDAVAARWELTVQEPPRKPLAGDTEANPGGSPGQYREETSHENAD